MSNLKDEGYLEKTNEKAKGDWGKDVHLWKIGKRPGQDVYSSKREAGASAPLLKLGETMNQKLSWWDRISIQFKRNVRGWKIKKIAKHYKVTTRTIYRVLKN